VSLHRCELLFLAILLILHPGLLLLQELLLLAHELSGRPRTSPGVTLVSDLRTLSSDLGLEAAFLHFLSLSGLISLLLLSLQLFETAGLRGSEAVSSCISLGLLPPRHFFLDSLVDVVHPLFVLVESGVVSHDEVIQGSARVFVLNHFLEQFIVEVLARHLLSRATHLVVKLSVLGCSRTPHLVLEIGHASSLVLEMAVPRCSWAAHLRGEMV